MFSEILSKLHTVEDQSAFVTEIDLVLDSIYKLGKDSVEQAINAEVDSEIADVLSKELTKADDKESFLKQLRKAVVDLEEIKIDLAYIPSKRSLSEIYEWVSKNTNASFVISYSVNPQLICGADISYKGKFYSGHMREQITNLTQKANEK